MTADVVTGLCAAPPKLRGFAAMTPERRSQISSLGGRAAHQQGVAHTFTSDEAREAAKKPRRVDSGLVGRGIE